MFSGIVEELGVVSAAVEDAGRLRIAAPALRRELVVGDSVAISGCCLTVVEIDDQGFVADVMPETVRCTTLAALRPGDTVNLEPAMAYGDRVGGHLVSGHVDAVGTVDAVRDEGNARVITIAAPDAVMRHVVPKGCVAADGISLTVVGAEGGRFTVSLIPHTLSVTTAQWWAVGTPVNLEADLLAKYVEHSLAAQVRTGG